MVAGKIDVLIPEESDSMMFWGHSKGWKQIYSLGDNGLVADQVLQYVEFNTFRVMRTEELVALLPSPKIAESAPISLVAASLTASSYPTASVCIFSMRPSPKDNKVDYQISCGYLVGRENTHYAAYWHHAPLRAHMPDGFDAAVNQSGTWAVQAYQTNLGLQDTSGNLSKLGPQYHRALKNVENYALAIRNGDSPKRR